MESSAPRVVCLASGALMCRTEGSDSSSATKGSSMVRVADEGGSPAFVTSRGALCSIRETLLPLFGVADVNPARKGLSTDLLPQAL